MISRWLNQLFTDSKMIIAFIIATAIAIFFAILWSEEKERRVQAEMKIKQLLRDIKKLKSKGGPAVVEKSKKSKGFAIPKPEKKKEEPLLDPNKLASLHKQTKIVQEMLAEIFVQKEEQEQDAIRQLNQNTLIETLGKLLSKEQWTLKELEAMVGPDVMIGNLLEQINDYAYPIVNDIVVEEDGENIYVTTDYKEQLI